MLQSTIMISERGKALTVWIIVFTVLTFITLLLRLWAARIQKRHVRLDDYFVVGAFVCRIPLSTPGLLKTMSDSLIDLSSRLARHHILGYISSKLTLAPIMANVANRHCQWPRRTYGHDKRRATDGAEKGVFRRP